MSDLEARVVFLERMVASLTRQLRQSVAFARSTTNPIDSGPVQTIQGQLDGLTVKDGVPVLMHYGYHAVMPPGGDKVIVFANADRANGVVVATGHQSYRPTNWNVGESGLYDQWGHSIRLQQSLISIAGNVQVTGDLHVTGAVVAGFGGGDSVTLQNHKHGTGTAASGTVVPTAGT